MKNNLQVVLLFILLFTIRIYAHSKVNGGFKSCTINKYEFKFGDYDKNSKELYLKMKYDENGKITEELKYIYGNRVEYKNIFKYDTNGKLIEKGNYDGYDNLYYKYLNKYDNNSNKIEYIEYDNKGIKKKIVYKYDTNNKLVEDILYNEEGKKINKNEYKYDTKGNIIERTVTGSDGNLINKYVLNYDGNGLHILTTVYNELYGNQKNNNELEYEEDFKREHNYRLFYIDNKYFYTYNNTGKIISELQIGLVRDTNGHLEEEERYEPESHPEGIIQGEKKYEYDNNGYLIGLYSNGDLGHNHTIYEYYSNGNIKEEIKYYSNMEIEYKYKNDINGNKIESIKYDNYGKYIKNEYKLDLYGNIIENIEYINSDEPSFKFIYFYTK